MLQCESCCGNRSAPCMVKRYRVNNTTKVRCRACAVAEGILPSHMLRPGQRRLQRRLRDADYD